MKGLALVGVLAAAAAVPPSSALADWRVGVTLVRADHEDRDYRRESNGAYRYGYDRGWREGSKEGRSDGRRGRDARYWRESDFRDADSGYRHWMGSRAAYRNGYRRGYADGYRREYGAVRPDWRDDDRGRRRERWDDDWRR